MSSAAAEQSDFQTRVNRKFEATLPDIVTVLLKAILTHDNAKAYAAAPMGESAPAPSLLQSAKYIRGIQEQWRKNLQDIIIEFDEIQGEQLRNVVLTAIASWVLKQAEAEVHNQKKLSISATDFMEWLSGRANSSELGDFCREQVRLRYERHQKGLKKQQGTASVSCDSKQLETASAITKDSAPETVSPIADGKSFMTDLGGVREADDTTSEATGSVNDNVTDISVPSVRTP